MTRYLGNSGEFIRVDDAAEVGTVRAPIHEPNHEPIAPIETANGARGNGMRHSRGAFRLPESISKIIGNIDVTLLLIFLFLYITSGDEEFLILLGALVIA
ncbi:MAG: hypothetical protein LBN02_00695 [Oscillospiraceae bacterium]|jgi:hypothetical protein|nr:hypothetical protein [Oscillospiraceae bacterium]